MKQLSFSILMTLFPALLFSQIMNDIAERKYPKHYISANPINMFAFQQLGVRYEFKQKVLGFGLSTGYIYPNHAEYSNWFIAGPTNHGSLGDYSGFYANPQINLYLSKAKDRKIVHFIFFYLKGIYKYMQVKPSKKTAWEHYGSGYYNYLKMKDQVNVYGGFGGFGLKLLMNKFFAELNLGVGRLAVKHDMLIYEKLNSYPYGKYDPPIKEQTFEEHTTANFSLNFGFAF